MWAQILGDPGSKIGTMQVASWEHRGTYLWYYEKRTTMFTALLIMPLEMKPPCARIKLLMLTSPNVNWCQLNLSSLSEVPREKRIQTVSLRTHGIRLSYKMCTHGATVETSRKWRSIYSQARVQECWKSLPSLHVWEERAGSSASQITIVERSSVFRSPRLSTQRSGRDADT